MRKRNGKEVSTILAQENIPATQLITYKLYYSKYRIAGTSDILNVSMSAIRAISPSIERYDYKVISSLKTTDTAVISREMVNYDDIIMRYKYENDFLENLKRGRLDEALASMKKVRTQNKGTVYIYEDALYAVAGISSLRTLLRKTAEEAGVDPVVIHALSDMYAQKVFAAKNRRNLQTMSEEMIYGYHKVIQEALRENYSKPIRKAANYIKLHLGEKLALSDIAEVARLAPNYLPRAFKTETGMTVTEYISKKRCEIAAELLLGTNLSVSEISDHVGYLDNNYFVKIFRSQYGTTPTKYRQGRNSAKTD